MGSSNGIDKNVFSPYCDFYAGYGATLSAGEARAALTIVDGHQNSTTYIVTPLQVWAIAAPGREGPRESWPVT